MCRVISNIISIFRNHENLNRMSMFLWNHVNIPLSVELETPAHRNLCKNQVISRQGYSCSSYDITIGTASMYRKRSIRLRNDHSFRHNSLTFLYFFHYSVGRSSDKILLYDKKQILFL